MAQESKIINIYVDKNKALYGAPFGHSEKYGKRPLDKLFLLMPGYSDEMLCDFVNRLFDQCDSEEAKDDMPPSIQTYLKARSYTEAIKNLGLLVGFYAEGEGFVFTPAVNNGSKGFSMSEEQMFELRPNCTRKEMANALKKALKAVQIGQVQKN
ncbi:MAG: hypothetical protein IIX18_03500 [Clostridia bacterium]|nr:hypothetical protein [Clostridia bacterium]MBQ6614365.1 hypothetical protein [Clostridia bacterium]